MPLTKTSARRRSTTRPRTAPDARKATKKNEQIIARVSQKWSDVPTTGRNIVAIDPGGSTGLAARYADGSWLTNTVTDPADLWDLIAQRPDVCVLEAFSTSGRVDKWMIHTIELVGGVIAACYVLNIKTFLHSPQKRYPWLAQAEAMLKGQQHTRHEVDALSHLLAFEGRQPFG